MDQQTWPLARPLMKKTQKRQKKIGDFVIVRVSVQGVKSLGGHWFESYEVKKKKNCYYFSKTKWKYFYTFNHFYSEKSSKRAN